MGWIGVVWIGLDWIRSGVGVVNVGFWVNSWFGCFGDGVVVVLGVGVRVSLLSRWWCGVLDWKWWVLMRAFCWWLFQVLRWEVDQVLERRLGAGDHVWWWWCGCRWGSGFWSSGFVVKSFDGCPGGMFCARVEKGSWLWIWAIYHDVWMRMVKEILDRQMILMNPCSWLGFQLRYPAGNFVTFSWTANWLSGWERVYHMLVNIEEWKVQQLRSRQCFQSILHDSEVIATENVVLSVFPWITTSWGLETGLNYSIAEDGLPGVVNTMGTLRRLLFNHESLKRS